MFRFLLLIAFFASLYWIFAPPAFLGTHRRRNALLAAIALGFARFVVFTPAEQDHPKSIEQTAVAPTPKPSATTADVPTPVKTKPELAKTAPPVLAMLGGKSLFTMIRRESNVYCPADGPLWIVAELGDEFVAVNGTARGWAKSENLSVFRDHTWIKVKDKDIESSTSQIASNQKLLETGLALCPQDDSKPVLEEGIKRLNEGKKRYVEIGTVYGLPAEKAPVKEGPMGKKTARTSGFGCEDADRFKRILNLYGAGDSQAAQRLLTSSLLAQQCIGFKSGDTVFVEDISVWSNTRCVRPAGETTCYWTTRNLVEESE